MKRLLSIITVLVASVNAFAEARFPKPDFTSGYEYPDIAHGVPSEQLLNILDILLLIGMMSLVVWAAYKK